MFYFCGAAQSTGLAWFGNADGGCGRGREGRGRGVSGALVVVMIEL